VVNIFGYRMSLNNDRHLVATYSLSRGFNGAEDVWRLGVGGFGELARRRC
jgi:hypothetical protein